MDGLRTIAVGAVLLYHYGLTAIPGGFVGVDVFFVISGYLITNILARDIRTNGLSITSFYNRRIRRILPAVLFVLLACFAAGWLLLAPGDYEVLGHSAAYSAAGGANLYFYWNTGYFDQAAELMPLLHLWSLGVEEQFYVVWPLLLAGIMWVARGNAWVTVGAILIVIAVSLAASVAAMPVDPKGAFFLPHLRAWELAVGALIAFLPAIRWRIISELAGIAGLALIAYSLVVLEAGDQFPGLNALPPVLGSALLIWPRAKSVTSWALSLPPMVFTGKISYSLYLWHWPVLVFFRFYANGELPTALEASILGAIAYLLSVFSWWVIERPFRRIKAKSAPVLFSGIAAIAATAAVGIVVMQQSGFTNRLSPQAQELSSLEVMWDWKCPTSATFSGSEYCAYGAPWAEASIRAMLWGDSHAEHMSPPLAAIAEEHGAAAFLYRGCMAHLDGTTTSQVRPGKPNYSAECKESYEAGIALLREHPEINLVILAGSWSQNMSRFFHVGNVPPESSPRGDGGQVLWDGLEKFMKDAAAPDRRFAIVADVPQWDHDPTPCALLEVSALLRRPCPESDMMVSKLRYDRVHADAYKTFREFAASHPEVSIVYPGDHMCSEQGCIAKLDGVYLYREGSHLRRNMSVQTNRALAKRIKLDDVFTSFVSRPAATRDEVLPDITSLPEQRIRDLIAIKSAIDAYKAEIGSYPPAYDGLKGVIDRGADWIPGLAPKYIAELPRDPALSDSRMGHNTSKHVRRRRIQTIAHGLGSNCGSEMERNGLKMDPARSLVQTAMLGIASGLEKN
ncbi:MAG: SGNH hydrolase domain-containing protein [Hyphomonadaceae bacterium]